MHFVTRCALLCVAFFGVACGGADVGFGVAVTLRFDNTLTDTALASIDTLSIVATGDESYSTDVALTRAPSHVERIVYRPQQTTRKLTLSVLALDGQGAVIARGSSSPLTLTAGHTTSTTIELTSPTAQVDGGTTTDGGGSIDAGGVKTPAFVTAASADVAAGPTAVAIGDLNGDQLLDIAVAATDGGKVQLFYAYAKGFFMPAPNAEISIAHPTALAIVDFTHDGKADLLVTDGASGNLYVAAGNGDGTFMPASIVLNLPGADSLVVADFNNNGLPDALIASSSTAGMKTLIAGVSATVITTHPITKMYATDINHDGAIDLVGVETQSALVSFMNNATTPGTFGNEYGLPTSGLLDLSPLPNTSPTNVIAASPSGTIALLTSDNNGVYSAGSGDIGMPKLSTISRLVASDVDADGKTDIVESVGYGNGSFFQTINFAFGADNQGSLPSVNTHAFATEDDPRGFALADIDGDGHLDAVLANYGSSSVTIYETTAAATVAAAPILFTTDALVGGFAADVNDDGKVDLLTTSSTNLYVQTSDGAGHFTQTANLAASSTVIGAAAAKLDGDNATDLAWVTSSGVMQWAFAESSGYSNSSTEDIGGTPVDFAAGDVTGDGYVDLVVLDASFDANNNSSNVRVFPGDGMGHFGTAKSYGAASPVHMRLGDLDGDGKADILVATGTGTLVAITQLGVATKTSPSPLPSLTSLVLVDADGDQKLDVVIGGASVHLLHGAGDGSFTDAGELLGTAVKGLEVGNFNGDTSPDVVALTEARIVTLVGANKTFAAVGSFTSGANGSRLAAGDFTSDGLTDVVAYGQTSALLVNATR